MSDSFILRIILCYATGQSFTFWLIHAEWAVCLLPLLTGEGLSTCHRPASLEGAINLAEDHLALPPQAWGESGQAPFPHFRRGPIRYDFGSRANPPGRAGSLTPSQYPFLKPSHQPSRGLPIRTRLGLGPRAPARSPTFATCGCCGWLGHKQHECPVMEVGQVVQVAAASVSTPGPDGGYQIPVKVQGCKHQAKLDSGSSQTLIHQSLVRPEALLDKSSSWVRIN